MKKWIIWIMVCSLATVVYAQSSRDRYANNDRDKETHYKRLVIGLSVGSGPDWLGAPLTEGYTKKKTIANLKYGINLDVNLSKSSNYYFSTGLFFSHNGGILEFMDVKEKESFKDTVLNSRLYRSVYLCVPFGLNLKTPTFGRFIVTFDVGILSSFKISAKGKDSYTFLNTSVSEEEIKDVNAFFWKESVYVGAGTEFIIKGDLKLFLTINYVHTFTNFFNRKAVNSYTTLSETAHQKGVEFNIGILF